MKILFSARPAYGHVYPLLPLALVARAAGHDVSFATAGAFVPKLRALGFTTYPAGITMDQAHALLSASLGVAELPRRADGRVAADIGGRLFLDVLAGPTAADLAARLPFVRPDLVVYEQYDVGAGVAASAAGIPAVCHALSPRFDDATLAAFDGGRLERLWAAHGGDPDGFDAFTGDVYLDIIPAVLEPRPFLADPARLPMRPVAYAEPGAIRPPWLGSARRPLVYLTLGTVVGSDDALRPAVEGLGALDVEVLVALGSAAGADLGPLPANVHVEAFVDQATVLPSADVVVHHGGSGTMLGALAAGVAQVVLPKGADQFHNGDRLVAAGLASVLEPAAATAAGIAAAASRALGHRRRAVDAVRDDIAALAHPRDVLDELLGRVTTGRRAA